MTCDEKVVANVGWRGVQGILVSKIRFLLAGDVPATADQMWNAAHNCTWPIAGGVRAWSSFLQGTKGQVEKRFITHCKGV